MRKRKAQRTCAGQLAGVQLKIVDIYNDALREHVTLVNIGTQAQPMRGWVLVSLRGEQLYSFPDDLVLSPDMQVSIHSGVDALHHPPRHLLWTRSQIWNNRSDTAVLFDANGVEIDRYVYPRHWTRHLRRTAPRRKRLVRDGDTWRMVDEPVRQQDASAGRSLRPEPTE